MVAREKVEFDVVGRDAGGSKAFKQVGDAAEKAGDQVEDLGKKSAAAGEQVDDLGDSTRKAGEQAEDAEGQYRGLANEIEQVEGSVRRLAAEIDKTGNKDLFKDLRRQQSELRKLTRIKDLLPDFEEAGEESASRFGASFVTRVGPLLASVPVGPAGVAIGGTLAAAMAPSLAAGLAAGVIGGAAGGGIVGGAILAARDPRVKAAGGELGAFVLGDLEKRAAGFTPVMLDSIDDIRAGWSKLGPDLTRIFGASRLVEPLVAGAVSGAQRLVGGVADAVDKADPVVASFGTLLDGVGEAAGDAFSTLANDADAGASSVDDLTTATRNFIDATTGILHGAAQVKRWSDEVDVAIDKGRYWTEDWMSSGGVLEHFGVQLDLTADGFKAGTAEAEAYRRATLGTAEAGDFATLAAAGMTSAQIAAADASGTYRAKTDEATDALHRTASGFSDGSQSVEEFRAKLEGVNQLLNEGIGANVSAEQANIRLEEAIDRATEAAKKNGDGIDANHPKQRANREALVGIASAAQTAAEKIFATTGSHDLAAKATERGRAKFLKTADAMGVEAGEAIALANQLFGIPEKRQSDVDVKIRETPIDLKTVAGRIAAIKSKRVVITVVNNEVTTRSEGRNVGIGNGVGGRASGGPTYRGETYWVGEEGPELLTFRDDGYVLNARQSADIAGRTAAASVGLAGTTSGGTARPGGDGALLAELRELRRQIAATPLVRLDSGRTADIYARGG